MRDKRIWFYTALAGLALSGLSMLVSVLVYIDENGRSSSYNLARLLMGDDFLKNVLWWYTGPVLWDMAGAAIPALTALAAVSLLCALAGLLTLRAQRPNRWQFRLTIAGLAGTGVPSVLVLLLSAVSGRYLPGTLIPGVAPVLTPIAMGLSIYAVSRRRSRVARQLQAQLRAQGLIRQGGEL